MGKEDLIIANVTYLTVYRMNQQMEKQLGAETIFAGKRKTYPEGMR
jgi:hypothetical protein